MEKLSLFAIVIFLAACSKEEGPLPYDPSNPIVGVWQRVARHTLGYDTESGETTYDNISETDSQDYLQLMANNSIYLGSYTDEDKRMNIGTYEFTGDSIFFDSNTIPNERQAVLELAREVMRLEYISDDGSDDGVMDVVRVTYRRIEN